MSRPVLRMSDFGSQVSVLQNALMLTEDGNFGLQTDEAVRNFQTQNGLAVDGVVGEQTWSAFSGLPPYPSPLPPAFDQTLVNRICDIARRSDIAQYQWRDRGRAPIGYMKGMALAYAYVYAKLNAEDGIAWNMARANTGNDNIDALSWYNSNFVALGMTNEVAGPDTLRHLWVLLLGLGMRESSGKYCEGRDMSATNVSSDTAEAGTFQMSWNASSSSTDMEVLMDEYGGNPPQCGINVWKEGVTCSSSSWQSYGSGTGLEFQEMAKHCPQFCAETTAVGLRRIRQHWGPINRKEVELKLSADDMFKQVQAEIDRFAPPTPGPGPDPEPEVAKVAITVSGPVEVKVNGTVVWAGP